MEKEAFFSGYCRTSDQSRMVCAVKEDGVLTEIDCLYENCPFTAECTVAEKITDFLKQD